MVDSRLAEIVRNCRNATASSCGGYLEPTATGQPGAYVSTILLSTGAVNLEQFPGYPFDEDLDQGMAEIVSYDRAECNDSYIGQVNMLQASSFSGVNGAIWGYDLAIEPRIGKTYPVGRIENIPIYSLIPLRDATRQLFGVADERHFPPQEGAMVVCAEKYRTSMVSDGNMWIWCALGFAIAEDRDNHASLFMEDTGILPLAGDKEQTVREKLDDRLNRIAYAAYLCGENQGARYRKIYIGWKASHIPKNHVGCALACAPYVTLPSGAFANISPEAEILELSTDDWLSRVGFSRVDEPDYALKTLTGPNIPLQ